MAKLITVVRTYSKKCYRYRNNQICIEIPDEAAKLIREFWGEHICDHVKAKYLAENQEGMAQLEIGGEIIGGINYMPSDELQENEVFDFETVNEDDEEDD